jgi:hypothetical protein
LRQNRVDRLGDAGPTIKSWNDYADARYHIARPVYLIGYSNELR